jgi:hypothetical protein
MNSSLVNTGHERVDKFKFDLESLIDFVFPESLQHPLAAGRLIAFGMYGPLDEENHIRTGIRGSRILAEYELEQMCLQLEKEDIIKIYLHRERDLGMLTSEEQESIVNQADAHLKKAKGKAMLPPLSKQDIRDLFSVRLPFSIIFLLTIFNPNCFVE